jgi:hypothetical protein
MTFLMLVAGGGVGVGLAAATTESSASPPPPTTPTTRPPAPVVPTTVAGPQSGEDQQGRGRHNGFDGSTVDLAPFGNVLVPPGHQAKTHGRSATPTTRPPATTPTTEPHTTTPTTQPHSTTTTTPTTTQPSQ